MIKTKLLKAIERSEVAYQIYLTGRRYGQALKIYQENQVVCELLKEYLHTCEKADADATNNYLAHLEGWFHQFEQEQVNKQPDDVFVFERSANGIAFPKDFKNRLV